MSLAKEELDGFKLKGPETPAAKIRPYIHWEGTKPPSPEEFKDFTFVVATISVANIGQMTVDLIRENLPPGSEAIRRGYFVCPKTLVSVAGEFGEGHGQGSDNLVSSCELYVSEGAKLVILQHRGVIAKGGKGTFVKYVMNLIQFMKFRKVLVLSSSFASVRKDRDLDLGPGAIHYMKCDGANGISEWDVSNKGWKNALENEINLGGTGIATFLLQQCMQSQVENLTIFLYTSDGDNRQEAGLLFLQANRVLLILPENENLGTIKYPSVWTMNSNPPPGIY